MVRIVIYCTNSEYGSQIESLLEHILNKHNEPLLVKSFVNKRSEFLKYVRNNPYLIMLIAQDGEEGRQTAFLARKVNGRAKMIWFSDKDFGLFSYELHTDYFGLLPFSQGKLYTAIDCCGIP